MTILSGNVVCDTGLIKRYGNFIEQLVTRTIMAKTEDEKRLIEFHKGLIPPQSEIEKAWWKYM